MKGTGDGPGFSYPLTVIPRDKAYEIESEIEVSGDAKAGITLFVSKEEYMGLSIDTKGHVKREQENFKRYYKTDEPVLETNRIGFKIVNNEQVVSFFVKTKNGKWTLIQPSMEVSQNGIIRPALFVYGDGEAKFEYFRYKIKED